MFPCRDRRRKGVSVDCIFGRRIADADPGHGQLGAVNASQIFLVYSPVKTSFGGSRCAHCTLLPSFVKTGRHILRGKQPYR